jgi:general secretion pathway protein L
MPERVLLQLDSLGSPIWLNPSQREAPARSGWPPEGTEVQLLLPAERVLLTQAPRVARSEGLLRQALPFAVEERLATPVEQLHFAFSGRGDALDLAVVEADWLREQLAQLASRGLHVVSACSEASLLPPAAPGEGVLVVADGRALLRSPQGAVLCERVELLPDLLALFAAPGSPPCEWSVFLCEGAQSAGLPAALSTRAQAAPTLLRLLGRQLLSTPPAPDLLQGPFAVRLRGDALPWLKRAAVIAALAVVLAFSQAVVERQLLASRIDSQRSEMAELLRQSLPGVSTVVDPRAQLEIEYTRLQRGAGGDDALALLAQIAPSIAGSSRYTLESIDYRNGALDLTLRAPDVATLDGLRETLAALGLAAELTSATPGQGGVEGRISLRGGRA